MDNLPKDGVKTTEFWLAATAFGGAIVELLKNGNPYVQGTIIVCVAAIVVGYEISRGLAKGKN